MPLQLTKMISLCNPSQLPVPDLPFLSPLYAPILSGWLPLHCHSPYHRPIFLKLPCLTSSLSVCLSVCITLSLLLLSPLPLCLPPPPYPFLSPSPSLSLIPPPPFSHTPSSSPYYLVTCQNKLTIFTCIYVYIIYISILAKNNEILTLVRNCCFSNVKRDVQACR